MLTYVKIYTSGMSFSIVLVEMTKILLKLCFPNFLEDYMNGPNNTVSSLFATLSACEENTQTLLCCQSDLLASNINMYFSFKRQFVLSSGALTISGVLFFLQSLFMNVFYLHCEVGSILTIILSIAIQVPGHTVLSG